MADEVNYRWSRFAHLIPLGEAVTVYNSLNLALTYVVEPGLFSMLDALVQGYTYPNVQEQAFEARDQAKALVDQLIKQRTLVKADENELDEYDRWKHILASLPIGVLYLLLTDACNFACEYCFVEGGIPADYKRSFMSAVTARRAIDLFAQALEPIDGSHDIHAREPQVLFYGGEALLNPNTLRLALEYIRELKDKGRLPADLGTTLNTNASLVDAEMADLLAEHQVTVSVSLDGPREQHDAARIYRSGEGTFQDVMNGFQKLKSVGANVSISCTLGNHNLDNSLDILHWIVNELGIAGFGFNMLVDSELVQTEDVTVYADKVSDTLIECFKAGRELGVYEDRMMRKARSFVEGRIYLNDCAGCGQQIVVTPDGQVGPCQAYLGTRKYFTDLEPDFDPRTHPIWKEWRMRSPLNMPHCVNCVALGICGGGCPHNADLRQGSIWAVDEAFCIYAKKTLNFLIDDLFEQAV